MLRGLIDDLGLSGLGGDLTDKAAAIKQAGVPGMFIDHKVPKLAFLEKLKSAADAANLTDTSIRPDMHIDLLDASPIIQSKVNTEMTQAQANSVSQATGLAHKIIKMGMFEKPPSTPQDKADAKMYEKIKNKPDGKLNAKELAFKSSDGYKEMQIGGEIKNLVLRVTDSTKTHGERYQAGQELAQKIQSMHAGATRELDKNIAKIEAAKSQLESVGKSVSDALRPGAGKSVGESLAAATKSAVSGAARFTAAGVGIMVPATPQLIANAARDAANLGNITMKIYEGLKQVSGSVGSSLFESAYRNLRGAPQRYAASQIQNAKALGGDIGRSASELWDKLSSATKEKMAATGETLDNARKAKEWLKYNTDFERMATQAINRKYGDDVSSPVLNAMKRASVQIIKGKGGYLQELANSLDVSIQQEILSFWRQQKRVLGPAALQPRPTRPTRPGPVAMTYKEPRPAKPARLPRPRPSPEALDAGGGPLGPTGAPGAQGDDPLAQYAWQQSFEQQLKSDPSFTEQELATYATMGTTGNFKIDDAIRSRIASAMINTPPPSGVNLSPTTGLPPHVSISPGIRPDLTMTRPSYPGGGGFMTPQFSPPPQSQSQPFFQGPVDPILPSWMYGPTQYGPTPTPYQMGPTPGAPSGASWEPGGGADQGAQPPWGGGPESYIPYDAHGGGFTGIGALFGCKCKNRRNHNMFTGLGARKRRGVWPITGPAVFSRDWFKAQIKQAPIAKQWSRGIMTALAKDMQYWAQFYNINPESVYYKRGDLPENQARTFATILRKTAEALAKHGWTPFPLGFNANPFNPEERWHFVKVGERRIEAQPRATILYGLSGAEAELLAAILPR